MGGGGLLGGGGTPRVDARTGGEYAATAARRPTTRPTAQLRGKLPENYVTNKGAGPTNH